MKNWCVQVCSNLNVPGFHDLCVERLVVPFGVTANAIKEGTSPGAGPKSVAIFHAYGNQVLRADRGLPPISVTHYQDSEFSGEHAVHAFISWLTRLDDQVLLLPERRWPDMPPRCKSLRDKLKEFASNDRRRLMVVRAQDAACASIGQFVAAFVDEYRSQAERLPIFYASVGRPGRPLPDRAVRIFPETRGTEDISEKLGAGGERMSLPLLVHALKSFLTGSDPARGRLASDGPELWRDILRVRELLSQRPVLLLFDGYSSMGQSFASLRSMLTGDPLSVLLPHLLENWPGHVRRPATRDNAGKSRIVVFCDADPHEFERYDPLVETWPTLPPAFVGETFHAATRWQILNVTKHSQEFTARPFSDVAAGIDHHTHPITDEDVWALLEAQQRLGVHDNNAELRDQRIEISFPSFLNYLKEHHVLALTMIRFLALSPGGLRYVTIWNLMKNWRQLCLNDAAIDSRMKFGPKPVRIGNFFKQARKLQPLLVEVRDDFVRGLDDSPTPWASLDPPDEPALEPNMRLRMVDFRSRRLRELVHDHLVKEPAVVTRMHRLLAEEFLRQHTIVARHRPEREPIPVDAMQSVCQMLFHGWASLGRGPGEIFHDLSDVPRTLPLDPTKIYIRLYSIFFRQLLEGEHRGDTAARIVNVEALKSDLLRVAISVDLLRQEDQETFFYRRTAERESSIPAGMPSFLHPLDEDSGLAEGASMSASFTQKERARIALDQLVSFANSQLQQNRLGSAERVRAYATSLIKQLGDDLSESERSDVNGRLGHIELQIKRVTAPGDLTSFGLELDRIGWSREAVAAAVREVREKVLADEVDKPRYKILEKSAKTQAERLVTGLEAADIRARADFMGDYADILWTEVEAATADEDSSNTMLLESFIGFRVAEHLRRQAFDIAPRASHAIGDSHHVRAFVRVALRLASQLAPVSKGEPPPYPAYPGSEYFVREARRQADLQSLFFGFTDADRASIHMVEARFYATSGERNLIEAWKRLLEAERWMLPTADRPRARYRLLYERAGIARERARDATQRALKICSAHSKSAPVSQKKRAETLMDDAGWWIRQAAIDLEQLRTYAREDYWIKLHARGSGRLAKIAAEHSDGKVALQVLLGLAETKGA